MNVVFQNKVKSNSVMWTLRNSTDVVVCWWVVKLKFLGLMKLLYKIFIMRTQKFSVFIVTTKGNDSWGLTKSSTDVVVSWFFGNIEILRLLGTVVEIVYHGDCKVFVLVVATTLTESSGLARSSTDEVAGWWVVELKFWAVKSLFFFDCSLTDKKKHILLYHCEWCHNRGCVRAFSYERKLLWYHNGCMLKHWLLNR